jgi:cell division protein ZapA (FtsZ GTPase activity inhibitor)
MSGKADTLLEFSLGGEKVRLRAADEEHEALRATAEAVNTRINDLRQKGGALTLQRAAVMAAFQFACEMNEMENSAGLTKEARAEMTAKIDAMISRIDAGLRETKS